MMRLKSLLPSSLFYRFLLIIVLPMMLTQLTSAYVFYQRHWRDVSERLRTLLVDEIVFINTISATTLPGEGLRSLMGLDMDITENACPHHNSPHLPTAIRLFKGAISKKLQLPVVVQLGTMSDQYRLFIPRRDECLTISFTRKRLDTPTTYIYVLWMIGISVIFVLIAIFFMRTQIRTIRRLAIASEKLGKGENVSHFKPEGALEVRKAGHAFLLMKERIERHIRQRTEVLAAVSHDLRTPLTRIKLLAAMSNNPKLADEMGKDIRDMEHLIQEYLNFSKGAESESKQLVDLIEMVRTLVRRYSDMHPDHKIIIQARGQCMIKLRPRALERSLHNLIDNAIRYGRVIEISVSLLSRVVRLTIDDDGPGIARDKRDDVFKPFVRLDESRNPEQGGAGLGLAVAKDIINAHGGSISLEDSPLGGIRVSITLPL